MTAQIYSQCILLGTTYGAETWILTKQIIHKMQVHQRGILSITLEERKPNLWNRPKRKVDDITQLIATLKGKMGRACSENKRSIK